MKTTYNDIFVRMSVLVAIPATVGERSLKPSTSTSLVLLRAQHSRKIEEFEDTVRKGLEELKKQERFKDFDELAAKAHEPAKDGTAREGLHDGNILRVHPAEPCGTGGHRGHRRHGGRHRASPRQGAPRTVPLDRRRAIRHVAATTRTGSISVSFAKLS